MPVTSGASLKFYDDAGHKRSAIGLSTLKQPALWLYAPDGKTVETTMAVDDSGPALSMWDRNSTLRAHVGADTAGAYAMSLYDAAGITTWKRP